MMLVRKLNDHGLAEFNRYINDLKSGTQRALPAHLIASGESSLELPLEIEVDENRSFETRYDIGQYLVEVFREQNIQPYMGDTGFWSWFALLWFNQLCPADSSGIRKPSMAYNYILSSSYNHRPRHAIYMTWQLVDSYGEPVRFLLSRNPATRGELMEQLMARQEFYTSRGAVMLSNRYYCDTATGGFKKGAAGRGAGSVTRFVSMLQQLQMTYDVFSMTMAELDGLFPAEFDRFRPNKAQTTPADQDKKDSFINEAESGTLAKKYLT
jgi:hypothetical protein